MNGVGSRDSSRTSVPKSMANYPPLSSREVKNVSANQRRQQLSCFSDQPDKHKLGRGCWIFSQSEARAVIFFFFQLRCTYKPFHNILTRYMLCYDITSILNFHFFTRVVTLCKPRRIYFMKLFFQIYHVIKRIWNQFSFNVLFYKTLVLHILSQRLRDIPPYNLFCKISYKLKIHFRIKYLPGSTIARRTKS